MKRPVDWEKILEIPTADKKISITQQRESQNSLRQPSFKEDKGFEESFHKWRYFNLK